MAASDKNIVISPQRGSTTNSPSIVFTGDGNDPISIYALDGVPGSLSFEGSAGQLFSITNNLTSGSIFSVNDVSGIPSLDVDASGLVKIAPLGGTVAIGQSTVTAGQTVDIKGNLRVDGTLTITSTANIANLNADFLDGLNSTQFLRSDASGTLSGTLTLANSSAQLILDHATQNDQRWALYSWASGLNIYPIDAASTIFIGRDGQSTTVDLYNISNVAIAGTNILNSSRQLSNVTFGGNTIWHAGNDGAGSGLDADLLDGISSGSFLRSDANDSASGTYSFSGGGNDASNTPTLDLTAGYISVSHDEVLLKFDQGQKMITSNDGQGNFNIRAGHDNDALHVDSASGTSGMAAITLDSDGVDGQINLYVGPRRAAGQTANADYGLSVERGTSGLKWRTGSATYGGSLTTAYTVWHSGNDGSGSGLDADTIDGLNQSTSNTANTIVSRDGSGNFSAGTITATLSGNASTATLVNGTSGHIERKDDRIIEPNSITSGRMQFGFTSWANNNSAPYADYLHLRSYTDSSGGLDNLVMFKKDGIGMRIWQQSWNSASAYSSYADVWTNTNDGSGSGLDADLLDGIDSGSFLRSDANDSFSGNLTNNGNNHITFGPNSSWGKYLRIGSNGYGGDANTASLATTDGNLHMDAAAGNGMYLNYYAGTTGVGFGNGAGGIVAWMGPDGDLWKGTGDNNGSKYWHAGNDGAGSGLDADYLDGLSSASFLRSDANDVFTGVLDINGTVTIDCGNTTTGLSVRAGSGAGNTGRINLGFGNGGNNPKIQLDDVNNDMFWGIGAHDSPNNLYIWGNAGSSLPSFESHAGGVTSNIQFEFTTGGNLNVYGSITAGNGNTVWHAGNDGSGSGLDADTLDGINSSGFVQTPGSSSTFISSNSGGVINPNNTTINGLYYCNSISLFGQTDGALYSQAYSSDWQGQIFQDYRTGQLAIRGKNNGTWQSWRTVWDSSNDGAGSGLDADNLDGYTWTSSGKNVRATEFYADNWFRNYNAGEGLYNEATGCHFVSDASDEWTIRDAGNSIRIEFQTNGTTLRGSVYADNAPSIGFLNSGNQWGLRYLSNDGNSPNLYFREEGNETWTGNPGNDIGKIEYHSNRFYMASGNNSTEIVRFRRSASDVARIDNSGYIYSPRFVDWNDNNFFADPASTSRFNSINLNSLQFDGRVTWDTANTSQNGTLSLGYLLAGAVGNKLYTDEDFNNGTNSISLYNNAGGTALSFSRIANTTAPNSSRQILRFVYNGGSNGTSPGFGGFYFGTATSANRTLVCRFKAKLKAGSQFDYHSNAIGTNGTQFWVTSQSGTGRWEEYVSVVMCGDSGTFSSTHFYAVSGGSFAAAETLFDLASASVYDITNNTSTFTGSLSGNASTATTLQTARLINGTSFNGSANITTANWGTARTLTIGSTGKSVNGSGNVSWTLAEIGALGATAKAADSELLDGINSGSFLRSDASDEYSGQTSGRVLRFRMVDGRNAASTSGNLAPLEVYQNSNATNSDAFMAFHISGRYAGYFGLNRETNDLFWGGWSRGAAKYRVWHAANDGSGTGLDADLLDGVDSLTRTSSHRANRNISGGGTITVNASGSVLWSSRFIVISNGRGSNFAASGYFDITCPTSGTITGVGGAGSVTATAAGIPLGAWQALYYILPIGSTNGSVAANFRVVSYTTDLNIPHEWVLICIRNGDNGAVTFNNGITLSLGQSMNSIQQTNANTGNTLVRRDGSGNFSAGTITAALSGNATTATRLQTARNINGTSFNGSANITTANWGTARNISIGGTSKSVNGSANVTWATSEIAAQTAVTLANARNINGTSFNGSANITTANWGTARNINGTSINGSTNYTIGRIYDGNYRRITNPGGGEYVTTTSTVTGAIRINYPVGFTNTMHRITIRVYEYTTNESFEIHAGGYNYSSGTTWANNPFAYIVGNPNKDRRFTVRFGRRASGVAAIYIGETNSTWSYPQIFITEVQCGYSGTSSSWTTGWSVDFATSFENVTATISDCQVGYAVSTGTVNTVVKRDSLGNFAANIITASLSGNASSATGLATSRTINGTSFNGTANITTANWGTARNITIGGTTRSVNGSGNYSWTVAQIGALASGATTFPGDATNRANITTRVDSGFYEHDTATTAEGWPLTSNTWAHLLACTHSNDSNYYSMQISASFYNNSDLFYRSTNGSGTTGWTRIWNATNDGQSSGLDADLLHGKDGSLYLHTTTSFGGDVSGTYNNLQVANDSHTHAFNNLTSKTSGTGNYTTSGNFTGGRVLGGSGTNTAPSISFSTNTNTGFYRVTTNVIGVTCNSSRIGYISVNGPAWERSVNILPNAGSLATATTTTVNSDRLYFIGRYWNGSASADSQFSIYHSISNTTPTSVVYFGLNGSTLATLSSSGTFSTAGNLLPRSDNTGVVGNASFTWNNGQFTNLTVDSTLTVTSTLNVRAAIDLADNDILRLGSSDDWEFFHNGSHNYMDLNVGNLYIRATTSTRFTFERTTGNFIATGNVTAYSDENLKENIELIPNALEKLQTLRGVTYTRKDLDTNDRHTGIIAQEVEKVLPEAVSTNEEGIKSVAYGNMVGLLIEAIKEQQKQIDSLNKIIRGES